MGEKHGTDLLTSKSEKPASGQDMRVLGEDVGKIHSVCACVFGGCGFDSFSLFVFFSFARLVL